MTIRDLEVIIATPVAAVLLFPRQRATRAMRVFLSHSSRQKPLVREIRACLPPFLTSWIDEENLLFGDDVSRSISSVIKTDTDYVLLFIDSQAVHSSWVRKEIEWTLEIEKARKRTILLPIVIEDGVIDSISSVELRNRKYLHLADYQETSVRSLGRSIADALFALICRDMQRLHQPDATTAINRLAESDALLKVQAALIHKVVFPHRSGNPIEKGKLLEIVNAHNQQALSLDDFDAVLTAVMQRNLVPGLNYDGFCAFLVEEHAQWKRELNHAKKERVGRRAVGLVQNGMKLVLDAGSTIEEVVGLICKRIETRSLTRLTIATTSVNIADIVSDCCVKMGFDDDYSAVNLLVPGGKIRPNTQAIVPFPTADRRDLLALAEAIGGFDLGMVGVNGIGPDGDLSTHDNAEAINKRDLLAICRRRVVLGDTSKIGINLEERFAHLSEDVTLVLDQDEQNEALGDLVRSFSSKILLAP